MKLPKAWASDVLILCLITLLITFAVWLPYLLKVPNFYGLNFSDGFNTIYRNYDGLEYVVIAISFYNPQLISQLPHPNFQQPIYYAARFPGYSLLILLFAPIFGFIKSMLFVSVLFTMLSTIAFYFLLLNFKLTERPLWLSVLFLILPARWLVVHSVGSAEPIFIFFTITSLYFFMRFESEKKWKDIILSSLLGVCALLTRSPGILLFIALGGYITFKVLKQVQDKIKFKEVAKEMLRYFPLLLIPLSLIAIFFWFGIAFHDFFAYFHSGDNIHLSFPPFQVFNKNQPWVGEIWLEDIVYVLILGYLATVMLFRKKLLPMAWYALIYMIATSFVAHRDISRYALPVFPFALIAFEKVLVNKEFKIVAVIVTLAIYLYAQNFILGNTAPVANPQWFN